MYFRQRGEGYGIGAYGHDPITIEPAELERHPDGHQIATGPFSQEHWPESLGWAHELLPPLAQAGIAETFNGHFSFAVDNNSFAGPSTQVAGLWLADGIWVTHGGGTAKAVVDLMTTGRCALDLGPMHPDRLHEFQHSPLYVQGARQDAVRRGLRHHPPRPGARVPAGSAHDAMARALPRPRRGVDRERRLGARAVVPRQRRARSCRPSCPSASAWAQRHWSADDRARAPRDAHRRRGVRPHAVREGRGRGPGRRRVAEPRVRERDGPPRGAHPLHDGARSRRRLRLRPHRDAPRRRALPARDRRRLRPARRRLAARRAAGGRLRAPARRVVVARRARPLGAARG